jgi:hypothetical protein
MGTPVLRIRPSHREYQQLKLMDEKGKKVERQICPCGIQSTIRPHICKETGVLEFKERKPERGEAVEAAKEEK